PVSLGRPGPRSARRYSVDVVLQSRAPKHGSGRIYPETAVGHDRIAFLLLAIAINGGITGGLPCLWRCLTPFGSQTPVGAPSDTLGACGASQPLVAPRQAPRAPGRHLWGSSATCGVRQTPMLVICGALAVCSGQASGTLGMDADRVPGRGVQLCG